METTTKGAEMLEYTFRVDYTDGTVDVVTVSAVDILAAVSLVEGARENVDMTTLVGTRDHKPQGCLI